MGMTVRGMEDVYVNIAAEWFLPRVGSEHGASTIRGDPNGSATVEVSSGVEQ